MSSAGPLDTRKGGKFRSNVMHKRHSKKGEAVIEMLLFPRRNCYALFKIVANLWRAATKPWVFVRWIVVMSIKNANCHWKSDCGLEQQNGSNYRTQRVNPSMLTCCCTQSLQK
ncbi:hypothetical protein AVEN_126648-1 [Araneus ventricosus]|uniref:Uncharacterized protein n=1 Tax=Araneus ventricosus TaxID=182803 RepID=A0A4Y2K3U0_ARAVE|nr:hypothetical protein AVEN_126648-1 [Araneus ventricosus]